MKEKYQRLLIIVIIFFFFISCLTNIKTIIEELLQYTDLFIQNVFPTSFLFITFSSLFTEYQLIYYFQRITHNKTSYLYFFIMSLISGFPIGSLLIKDALKNNLISLKEANKLIMFCHFPNPLFIFYTVFNVIGNYQDTIVLYLIIVFSNLIIYLLIKKDNNIITISLNSNIDFSNIISNSITKSFKTIMLIYGSSLLFYCFSLSLNKYINNIYLYVLINGLFDLTNGILSSVLISSILFRGLFILLFISIGSLAIQLQIKSILTNTFISYKNFIIGRLLSVLICINIWIIYCTMIR